MDVFTDGIYTPFALEVITDVVLKATILLSAAWLMTALLRHTSAALRYGIWSLVLSGLLVMPLVSVVLPAWEMSVPAPMLETAEPIERESAPETHAVAPTGPGSFSAAAGLRRADIEEVAAPLPPQDSRSPSEGVAFRGTPEGAAGQTWQSWVVWGVVIWLVGALVLLVRLLIDVLIVAWITRRAQWLPHGPHKPMLKQLTAFLQLRRPVEVGYSSQVSMPMMWGLWRPTVILPDTALAWSQERLRLVLLHELAHVKRWDYLTHLVAQLAWSLYWLNPLVWVAARRVSLEQERACDDLVLKAGTKASTYAEHLLDLTRALQRRGELLSPVAMAKRSTLKERIRAILNARLDRRGLTMRARVASGIIVAGLLLPLAALHLDKESNDEEARIERMIATLQSEAPEARQRAAWALGEQESPKAVGVLIESLKDTDAGVRSMAAWALGEIKDRRAVVPLIAALPDADLYAREMVVRALGELEDGQAVEALVPVVEAEAVGLRVAAAWALGEIKGSKAVAALAYMLKHEQEVAPRQAAVNALQAVSSPGAIQMLIAALYDEHPAVRQTAVRALTGLRVRQAIDPLIVTLQHDPVVAVRQLAARALGEFHNADAVYGLLVGLNDPSPFVRERSAWALGWIGNPTAIDALMPLLRDPDAEVRARVVWALDEISV